MDLNELMETAIFNGYITCPDCGNNIEPDCDVCNCGWENPIIKAGLI